MLELVGDDASGVGYLLKDRVRDVPSSWTRSSASPGRHRLRPEVVKALVGGHRARRSTSSPSASASVLSLVAEGRSNRAIAQEALPEHARRRAARQTIFEKLRLPDTEDDNRRVLAVLALLGQ